MKEQFVIRGRIKYIGDGYKATLKDGRTIHFDMDEQIINKDDFTEDELKISGWMILTT